MSDDETPFSDLARSPAQHFRLHFFAAVCRVTDQIAASFESFSETLRELPFLIGYHDELAALGVDMETEGRDPAWWQAAILKWEEEATVHLPLRALRESTGLGLDEVTLLAGIGLAEEDARFGTLFERAGGAAATHRITTGLLNAWWRGAIDSGEVRGAIRRLRDLCLIQVVNPEAPRIEWALQANPLFWDLLRGDTPSRLQPWLRFRPAAELFELPRLLIPDPLRETLARVPALVTSGEVEALLLRGPHGNGRRTIAGAIARALGHGLLEVVPPAKNEEEKWRTIGPLATILNAIPALVIEAGPGETVEIPPIEGYQGPLFLIAGAQGGVVGQGPLRLVTAQVEMPDRAARREHWRRGLSAHACRDLDEIAARFRMTSGHIFRAAQLSPAHAALAGRNEVTIEDARKAHQALNRQALETLAARMDESGDWSRLAVAPETLRELQILESRCRHREALGGSETRASGAGNAGVRALFMGPSGTGKTLGARLLAAALQMDLYRVDLAAVINKYIGETEKNLSRIFALAEELDVALLLDEGDALLTQRTTVQTSNDRYANLETDYLLQRIESFQGVLIVTTNAVDHIDTAFQRRMDVVVDFRAPEAAERWAIWQLHLPPAHGVDWSFLREVAGRCQLSGGQIKNAMQHAQLLALDDGGVIRTDHLEAAVLREYKKAGAVCPLRRMQAARVS